MDHETQFFPIILGFAAFTAAKSALTLTSLWTTPCRPMQGVEYSRPRERTGSSLRVRGRREQDACRASGEARGVILGCQGKRSFVLGQKLSNGPNGIYWHARGPRVKDALSAYGADGCRGGCNAGLRLVS